LKTGGTLVMDAVSGGWGQKCYGGEVRHEGIAGALAKVIKKKRLPFSGPEGSRMGDERL
jgi:hypothetical protein